ncbi:UDP-N-acetylglucosamine 2-epimerase, partial [Klebsiella pneumoniae]
PWPEEANRRLTSVLSQWHFAPTEDSKNNLLSESIPSDKVIVTGNTVIDALMVSLEKLKITTIKKQMEQAFPFIQDNSKVILITAHRRENHGE